jgi:hypothetical protein
MLNWKGFETKLLLSNLGTTATFAWTD